MKKRYITIFIAIFFVFHSGIALASVTSDSLSAQYQSCIKELATLDSRNYGQPDPTNPIYQPDSPFYSPSDTYAVAQQAYQNEINHREDVRAKCTELENQINPPILGGVHRDLNPPEPNYTETIDNSNDKLQFEFCDMGNDPSTCKSMDIQSQWAKLVVETQNGQALQLSTISDQIARQNTLLGIGAIVALFLSIAVVSLFFRQ